MEPLIDEVRPHCKVAHEDLRQTIQAILWRHRSVSARAKPDDVMHRPSSAYAVPRMASTQLARRR